INYVITDVERKRKFVCVDPNDIPDIAVVDPDMMSSMPKGLTASTGMDALTHAIEGYTTGAAWELADCLNLEAIQLIAKNLRKAVQNDPDGREGMALAQYVTAMAYSNVGLGIAHSMAHTLGAVYDTPHGVACAMMLPIVMEFNQEYTGEKFKHIAEAFGVDTTGMDQPTYRKAAIDAVRQLSVDVGIPTKLEKLREEDLPFLCESASADACAPGNPRHATLEQFEEMFRKLM
ncbi:MAG: iron-containing alcohol dehydrogenase, partial [Erysipelotrichales bacterium]|nr:iron-containing alcohol dehydrogenase [Erysipelotrichales bacterium]